MSAAQRRRSKGVHDGIIAQDVRREIDRPSCANLIDDLTVDLAEVHFRRGVDRNGSLSLLGLGIVTDRRNKESCSQDCERIVHTRCCTFSIEVSQARGLFARLPAGLWQSVTMTVHALDAEELPKGDSEPLCDFFSDEE